MLLQTQRGYSLIDAWFVSIGGKQVSWVGFELSHFGLGYFGSRKNLNHFGFNQIGLESFRIKQLSLFNIL